MKIIKEQRSFQVEANVIWDIISDISRCDWVPGVESIELEGNKRIFKMSGMGRLVEEIIECNDAEMKLPRLVAFVLLVCAALVVRHARL